MSEFDFDEIDKAVTGALGSDDTTQKDTPTPAPPTAAMPAARRGSGGRFMDVVHPSSDMRTRQPVSGAPSSPPAQQPEPLPEEAPQSQEVATHLPKPPVFDGTSNDVQSETTPLESPFLPDAKVEKRPLGSAMPSPLFHQEFEKELASPPEQEETLKLEAPEDMLIEAEASEPGTNSGSALAEVDDEVIGSISITQQYKEGPSPQGESGAIYDTESYHQPLAHPMKKRSAAWAVLWSAVLIVFGAGAGVLFYMFILPLL